MSDQMSMDGIASTETSAKTAVSNRARKRSVAAKLLQAAALAAVLVPLASVTAEASSCSFDGSGSPCEVSGSEGFALFEFADPTYKLGLRFDDVRGSFTVDVDVVEMNLAAALAKMVNYPDLQPVPIGSNNAAPYIDFRITDNSNGPCIVTDTEDCSTATNTWISEGPRGPDAILGWHARIYWTKPTDADFPDVHMLHATGDSEVYDSGAGGDITDPNDPYSTSVACEIFDTCLSLLASGPADPAVGGRDDMFSGLGLGSPTAEAVPEPASLLLLGSGIGGWLYRRRRQK